MLLTRTTVVTNQNGTFVCGLAQVNSSNRVTVPCSGSRTTNPNPNSNFSNSSFPILALASFYGPPFPTPDPSPPFWHCSIVPFRFEKTPLTVGLSGCCCCCFLPYRYQVFLTCHRSPFLHHSDSKHRHLPGRNPTQQHCHVERAEQKVLHHETTCSALCLFSLSIPTTPSQAFSPPPNRQDKAKEE